MSCYALLGVARRLDNESGEHTAGGREADWAFALERSRSEVVLWKAKEELARSSVSRVLNEYQQVSAAQRQTLEELHEGMEKGYTPSREIQHAVSTALEQSKKIQAGLEESAQQVFVCVCV